MKRLLNRPVLALVLALMVSFGSIVGGTIAWFTSEVESTGNVIKSGTLKMDVQVQDETGTWETLENGSDPLFNYDKWEPGYTAVKYIKITNSGTLAFKYRMKLKGDIATTEIDAETGKPKPNLAEVIDVYVFDGDETFTRADLVATPSVGTLASMSNDLFHGIGSWLAPVDNANNDDTEHTIAIVLKMRESAGNEYQNLTVGKGFALHLEATQQTYETDGFGDNKYDAGANYPSDWNGDADTHWYYSNPDAYEFTLEDANDLAGLAELIDDGVTDFEGRTIKLNGDVDLYGLAANGEPICFDPIGSYRKDMEFKGTFDGQGHTIKNLNQNTWALDNGYYYGDLGLGLFGAVRDATIKNLNIDSASISGESALCGTVAATAYGDCVFENINVTNSQVADYQYYAGGIVGWASGNHQYIDCDVAASTTIGGQWGDFNNANGGLIGGTGASGTYHFKDCDVAARIDVPNDVVSAYRWYSYRRSGMLVGDTNHTATDEAVTTAAAPHITAENCTVTYGDWANYHYCTFSAMGYPYVRVEGGISVAPYSNVRYGHPTDANGNTVVDDNHVHNDGEKHKELIVFDQLFGGPTGDRYCTYGLATHPGVTVIYNNK